MEFYGIRSRKSGKLVSIYAGVTEYGDDTSARGVRTGRRYIEYEGALLIGDYDRQPLFVTTNVDLAKLLVLTHTGDDHRNHIELSVGFGLTSADFEVVTVPDMTVVPLEPYSEDLIATLKWREESTGA